MKCLFVLCGHMSLDLEETLLYSKVMSRVIRNFNFKSSTKLQPCCRMSIMIDDLQPEEET